MLPDSTSFRHRNTASGRQRNPAGHRREDSLTEHRAVRPLARENPATLACRNRITHGPQQTAHQRHRSPSLPWISLAPEIAPRRHVSRNFRSSLPGICGANPAVCAARMATLELARVAVDPALDSTPGLRAEAAACRTWAATAVFTKRTEEAQTGCELNGLQSILPGLGPPRRLLPQA